MNGVHAGLGLSGAPGNGLPTVDYHTVGGVAEEVLDTVYMRLGGHNDL